MRANIGLMGFIRYFLVGLLLLSPFFTGAQSICKVYQTPADGSAPRKLVMTRKTDEQGRPQHEMAKGYTFYLDNLNTMYSYREDGVYEYYYDSVHYKTVFTELDDVTKRPVDSNKVFYYYDDSNINLLVKEVSVKHLKKRVPGRKPGSFRNTITYKYNKEGKVAEKKGSYGDNTIEYLIYDEKGRVVTDSVVSAGMKDDDFCMVTKYEYSSNGYREYAWVCDRKFPIITVFVLDDKGRVTEQAVWFHKNDDKDGSKTKSLFMKWQVFMNNDFKTYKEYERTVVKYDDKDRIAESFYYFEGKHTTTHTFEYE